MAKKAVLMVLIICTLMIIGCAQESKTKVYANPQQELADRMPEDMLISIHQEDITLAKGMSETNSMLLRNAYDKPTLFKIKTICETCLLEFTESEMLIGTKEVELIQFRIKGDAEPGTYKQTIKVTDAFDNAYAVKDIMVTIR